MGRVGGGGERGERGVIGGEEDEAFRCEPYPPPKVPCVDYVQELDFRTEGLQLTLSDEELKNVSFGRFEILLLFIFYFYLILFLLFFLINFVFFFLDIWSMRG